MVWASSISAPLVKRTILPTYALVVVLARLVVKTVDDSVPVTAFPVSIVAADTARFAAAVALPLMAVAFAPLVTLVAVVIVPAVMLVVLAIVPGNVTVP